MKKNFAHKFIGIALTVCLSLFVCSAAFAAAAADAKTVSAAQAALRKDGGHVYPLGVYNEAHAQYFTGDAYMYTLLPDDCNLSVINVTFAPGVINYWHVHNGSCQVLAGASGRGYYQLWGEEAKEILPGETVIIPEGRKHWHGAQEGHWFQHVSSVAAKGMTTTWLEPVDSKEYEALAKRPKR